MFTSKAVEPRRPNFFIVGAAKCGTTSLARYLAEHPHIFFSDPKEPRFFLTDIEEPDRIRSEKNYLRLFARATSGHLAIGEGSTLYIYSKAAVPRILEFNPQAKFIVMLRSPVEMACSLHSQRLYSRYEDEADFERAWRLQDERRAGRRIPYLCPEPKLLLYGEVCRLGEQLERLYGWVPRERVLVRTLDDLHRDPPAVYEAVLAFLGVPSDGRTDFPVYNENQAWRLPALASFMSLLGAAKRRLVGVRHTLYVRPLVAWLNTVKTKRPALTPQLRSELCNYFRNDVGKLSALLGRDLSHWLSEDDSSRAQHSA